MVYEGGWYEEVYVSVAVYELVGYDVVVVS